MTHAATPAAGYGGGFALLVVLFILLVIIGASWAGGYGY
ncbi:YjcZ family sporulation protein [Alkalihalobacillus sp. MEB130]|nr:YjcZ family sporulation protein [Alkalihalobacillus sp. MEB130]MDT8861641.1 YjcZ family sporulation protein [Alkalihalobacillus sp. MEB130]